MKTARLIIFVLFNAQLFLSIAVALAQPEFDAGTRRDALVEKLKNSGSVRVIVGIDANFTPEGSLSSARAVDSQQNGIARAQSRVLSRIPADAVSDLKLFKTIPAIAMEINSSGLQALIADPAVLRIQEDVPEPLLLTESIPFIEADDLHSSGYDGTGYAVAVIDTGVRKTHEFLDNGKVVSEACYSTTSATYNSTAVCTDGSTAAGSGVNCDPSLEGCSHGTHVAGIVAGNGRVPGRGVAPGADIIAIQVFSRFESVTYCGSVDPCVLTFRSDQISGLERVYNLRNTYNIAAANMSLGGGNEPGYCDNDLRKPIIDNLRSAGIATVIASGNSSYNDGWNNAVAAPGCISSAITVGATLNDSDAVASYSNHANMVDLMAPGSTIYSSVADTDSSYSSYNGTSMASPHVAGAFAVMKDYNGSLTVTQIEEILESTGSDVSGGGVTKPRINLLAATQAMEPSVFPWQIFLPGITNTTQKPRLESR